jgi:hypothetical protein
MTGTKKSRPPKIVKNWEPARYKDATEYRKARGKLGLSPEYLARIKQVGS